MITKKITTIVLIEHNSADAAFLQEMLLSHAHAANYSIIHFSKLSKGLQYLKKDYPRDVVISDITLLSAPDVLSNVATHVPIILMSTKEDENRAIDSIKAGVQDYLIKGNFNAEVLLRSIRYAIERKKFDDELIAAKAEAENTRNKTLQSEERLALAQRAGNIGTYEFFIPEKKIVWTEELEALYGLEPGEFKGTYKDWVRFVHPEDLERVNENLQTAINGGAAYNVEFRIILPNNTERWILAKGKLFTDEHEQPLRMIGINMDITERKRLEHQKDTFIGVASHELKTPVTSLKLFSDIIVTQASRAQNTEIIESADVIKQQTNRLVSLVNDLLDVSKIQVGRLELNKELFDLTSLIKDTAHQIQHNRKSHDLIIKNKLRKKVYGDRDRISQVLINLLTNAIKYSPHAHKVVITVSDKNGFAVVNIQDFGFGISKEEQSKVFERFFRTMDSKNRSIPGFGLGLNISWEIIRRHGGALTLKSIKGKGSTFTFTLPLTKGKSLEVL